MKIYLLWCVVLAAACCAAQSSTCVNVPNSAAESEVHGSANKLTDTAGRLMGVRPTDTVNTSANVCPPTNAEKFRVFLRDSYSPFNMLAAGFQAGILQASQGRAGYGQGWDAYGSRFGAALADNVSSDFFQSFVFPALLHQDPRYFRMRNGTVLHRGWYAATRVFVTHGNGGRHAFNYSEVLGGLAASGLADSYYPSDQRDAGKVFYRAGLGVATDAGWDLLREFGPDISRKLFHRKK